MTNVKRSVATTQQHDTQQPARGGLKKYTRLLAAVHLAGGPAYAERQDYPSAINDFSAAIRLDPSNSAAQAARADALGKLGLCVLADEDREKVRQHDPIPSPAERDRYEVRAGYQVIGYNHILAVYPLTPEGREAAITYADELARDIYLRFELYNQYLTRASAHLRH